MGHSSYVHLDVDKILYITDAAFLLDLDGDKVWVPRSCIADPDDYEVGDTDLTISIADWFAEKKGLI
jgi:hypothetical protein